MGIGKKRPFIAGLLGALLIVGVLFGCGGDAATKDTAPAPTAEPGDQEAETVKIAGVSYPADTEQLSAVIEAEDIDRLKELTELKSADLSGSTCYEDISSYEREHPEVAVTYAVILGGTEVSNRAQSAAIAEKADVEALIEGCGYLPDLAELDLRAAQYSPEEIRRLQAALPKTALSYTVTLNGFTCADDTESLDLSGLTGSQVVDLSALLSLLPKLSYVNLTNPEKAAGEVLCDITPEQLALVQEACPGVGFDYIFALFGRQFSTADTAMDLANVKIGRGRVDEVRAWLPYMTVCTLVDMDGCGIPNTMMAELRDDFPNMKVVWRIYFSSYSCRTDAVALRASTINSSMSSDVMQVLKYCTDMEMLDLGHNSQADLSYVSYMPKLRVAILAIGYAKDLTPLASCLHLEYLELFSNSIADISPLAGLKELEHLNIANNCITDISPLFGMTQLKRLWIARNNIPEEQIEELIAALPNTEIDYTSSNPTGGTWRKNERYDLLRIQFHYDAAFWIFD